MISFNTLFECTCMNLFSKMCLKSLLLFIICLRCIDFFKTCWLLIFQFQTVFVKVIIPANISS